MFQVIKGQAAVHRCSVNIDFLEEEYPMIPPIVNKERIYDLMHHLSSEIVGVNNTHIAPRFLGSEDFAFYLDQVPGSLLLIGTRNERIGSIYSPHSPYYSIDEDVLPIGAAIHAAFAYSYLLRSTR